MKSASWCVKGLNLHVVITFNAFLTYISCSHKEILLLSNINVSSVYWSHLAQRGKLERCHKRHFVIVTDQITYPHFATNSKKTIMVLLSRVSQDHWDLKALVRTKTRGSKTGTSGSTELRTPATDTDKQYQASLSTCFSCNSSHCFLLLSFCVDELLPLFGLWGKQQHGICQWR